MRILSALVAFFLPGSGATTELARADFGASIIISLVIAAIMVALSEILRPKPKIEDARPANLGDFKFPTAMEGRVIPVIWGTVRLDAPNVVWYGDFRQDSIEERIKTGLWSRKTIVKGYRYYVGIQMALCCGQIDALKRIWIGDTEVWSGTTQDGAISINKPELHGGDDFGHGGVVGTFRIHSGSLTQATNSYLSGKQSPLPAYRGTAYGVFEGGYIGNSTSISPWKFEVQRIPNGLGLTGGKDKVNTSDANPMNVVYEYITDGDWGLGFPAGDIDTTNFTTAADTLYNEGNGFSFGLDNALEAGDFLAEIERQIDGTVYLDQQTGKWTVQLARGGYDVDTVPQLTASNIVEVKNWIPGTWEETANEVRVGFADRTRNYFETFAGAKNQANQKQQGGERVPVQQKYPGVKNASLAAKIASREIRQLSRPIGKATIIVDRSMWQLHPAQIVAWTDTPLGFTKKAMRVGGIDFGNLAEGQIELTLVEDAFEYQAAHTGDPQSVGWTAPTQDVTAPPAAESVAFGAPYALIRRDPDDTALRNAVWISGRDQTGFAIGGDLGTNGEYGSFAKFMVIGELGTALSWTDAQPTATIRVDTNPDNITAIKAALVSGLTKVSLGESLFNLIMINGELMMAESYSDQTTYINLTNVWRGCLQTVPYQHAIDDKVFLLCNGGALTTGEAIPDAATGIVYVVKSRTDTDSATISMETTTWDKPYRYKYPIPPAEMKFNATRMPTTFSFALKSGSASDDLDDYGVLIGWNRRDWRTFDEIASIENDAADLDSTFPSHNTTQYKLVSGWATGLSGSSTYSGALTVDWSNMKESFVSRTEIMRVMQGRFPNESGSYPNNIIRLGTRHTWEGEATPREIAPATGSYLPATNEFQLTNWGQSLRWAGTVTKTTWEAGAFNKYQLSYWTGSGPSEGLVVTDAGVHSMDIGTALPTSDVEYRLDTGGGFGAWTQLIANGNRTGSFGSLGVGDVIEWRHHEAGTGTSGVFDNATFYRINTPNSGANDAYGILVWDDP